MAAHNNLSKIQFHGTGIHREVGDYLDPGKPGVSPTNKGIKDNYTYFTPNVDIAKDYADTHGPNGRIYTVVPTGRIENDPDETDSWRSRSRLRVTGEVRRDR